MSAETKAALAASTTREERLQAAATNNLKLQVVDPEYATRAGANNAHFHLPRTGDDILAYVRTCVAEGTPLNALGLYAQYHIAALALAQRLASGEIPAADRAAAARDVIALEGFSIHWLEDIYASGHSVGTWGSSAWRKGTHDYYNEFGIDTVDWKGRTVITFGDSNMKPADLARASAAVADSLRQLVGALRPGDDLGKLAQSLGPGPAVIRSFDSCKETGQPSSKGSPEMAAHFQDNRAHAPAGARARRGPRAAVPGRARAVRRGLRPALRGGCLRLGRRHLGDRERRCRGPARVRVGRAHGIRRDRDRLHRGGLRGGDGAEERVR